MQEHWRARGTGEAKVDGRRRCNCRGVRTVCLCSEWLQRRGLRQRRRACLGHRRRHATAPPGSNAATELSDDQVTKKLVGTKVARMGEVIENEDGFVLYRFDGDSNNPAKTNCVGDCAKVWPAALTNDGKPTLKGVDAKLVGTVTRPDGTKQLTVKGWPLYTYIGDKKPHTWKGQNVGGKWFVIKPDGAKNLTCLPAISKPVAPPADESGSESSDTGSSGSDYSY
jgi:predicted lipoprotein with Yx(FWY)xxD motif